MSVTIFNTNLYKDLLEDGRNEESVCFKEYCKYFLFIFFFLYQDEEIEERDINTTKLSSIPGNNVLTTVDQKREELEAEYRARREQIIVLIYLFLFDLFNLIFVLFLFIYIIMCLF